MELFIIVYLVKIAFIFVIAAYLRHLSQWQSFVELGVATDRLLAEVSARLERVSRKGWDTYYRLTDRSSKAIRYF